MIFPGDEWKVWPARDWERLRSLLTDAQWEQVEGKAFPTFVSDERGRVPDEVIAEFRNRFIRVDIRPGGPSSYHDLIGLIRYANHLVHSGEANMMTDWHLLGHAERIDFLYVPYEVPALSERVSMPTLEWLDVVGVNLIEAMLTPRLTTLLVEFEERPPRHNGSAPSLDFISVLGSRKAGPWSLGDVAMVGNAREVRVIGDSADVDVSALADAALLERLRVERVGTVTGLGSVLNSPHMRGVELRSVKNVPDALELVALAPDVQVVITRPGSWIDELRPLVDGRQRWFLPKPRTAQSSATLEDGGQVGAFLVEGPEEGMWNFSATTDPDDDLEARVTAVLLEAIPALMRSGKVYVDPENDFVNVVADGRRNANRVAAILERLVGQE